MTNLSSIDLALRAFETRPTRLEALADLSRIAREAGRNETAAMFARRGLAIPPSDDLLFVESFARDAMREDLSISGFYSIDPETRAAAARTCDELGLDRTVSRETRDLARQNLEFYLRPIGEIFPSWQARQLAFMPPNEYNAMAPSVTRHGDHIFAAQRTVNYKIDARGYVRVADDLPLTAGAKIHTRTFLVELDPETFDDRTRGEILLPADLPIPSYDIITGFEDTRLFSWRGYLWGLSTVLDQNPDARAEQWLARIDADLRMADARPIYPEGPIQPREKNWMPLVDGADLQFIYRSDPTRIIDCEGRTVVESVPDIAADHFSGSSQVIPFVGGWLAVVHWRQWFDGWPKYRHRFAWYDAKYHLTYVSAGWVFSTKQPQLSFLAGYEYCTGLCWHPDGRRLIVGFQIHERESWIGTIDAADICAQIPALRQSDISPRSASIVNQPPLSTSLVSPPELFPSWLSHPLRFIPPVDYAAMGTSVILRDRRLIVSVRCINYAPGERAGTYYRIADRAAMGGDVRPHSRTFLLEVDPDTLRETVLGELSPPIDLSPPVSGARSYGFEDIRLFEWDGSLWGIAAFAEQSIDGLPEQWLVKIGDDVTIQLAMPIFPKGLPRRAEKNWMPMIGTSPPRFIYLCDPTIILDCDGNIVARCESAVAADDDHGGSQAIPFDGGWLAVTHVKQVYDEQTQWIDFKYINRFVWLDAQFRLRKTSAAWWFPIDAAVPRFSQNFQLVAGLAWHPDGRRLMMGFELYEREPWMATLDADDVRRALGSDVALTRTIQDDDGWALAQTNRPLQDLFAIDRATEFLRLSNLPEHAGSPEKNWDTWLAVYHCLTKCRPDDVILDAGGDGRSSFLRAMRLLGYHELMNVNIEEPSPGAENGIRYQVGDITNLRPLLSSESVHFVLCQSVLEHGVDCPSFYREMARILVPGGHLFVSIDYWKEPTGAELFTPDDVRRMISFASSLGLPLVGSIDYHCRDACVEWAGRRYTFINLLFRRDS